MFIIENQTNFIIKIKFRNRKYVFKNSSLILNYESKTILLQLEQNWTIMKKYQVFSLKFIYIYKLQIWYWEPSFVRIYRKLPSIWKTTQKIRSIQLKMFRGFDVPKFLMFVWISDHNLWTPWPVCLEFLLGNSVEPREIS